jgi:hypothetical protein
VGGQEGVADGFSVAAPGKGKQTRVILDDDEATAADKEAAYKRAVEEATAKRAAVEAAARRAAKEAAVKKAVEERAAEEVAVKAAATEAAGAAGGSPSAAGAKRSVAPPRRPNVPTEVFGNLCLSSSLPFFPFFHSLTTLFVQVLSL